MNKKLFTLLLIISCSLLIGSPSYAGKLEGNGYILYDAINSGGGTLQGDGYTLRDSKGDAVGGRVGGDGYIYTPGLFGLIVTGEIQLIPPVPTGTVQLYIERVGSDIKIYWDPPASGHPQIFALIGDGTGKYTQDGPDWKKVAENGMVVAPPGMGTFVYGTNQILHTNQVGAGTFNEVYYKGIEKGINHTVAHPDAKYGGASYLAVAWAVGKVNVTVEKDGKLDLVGLPLDCGKVSDVFFGQLVPNKKAVLLPRSGSGLDYITVTNSEVVGDDFKIEPTVGFWFRNPNNTDLTITFPGSLVNYYTTRNLDTVDLTGNPLALPFSSSKLGIDGDIVLPQKGTGLDYFAKSGGSWGTNFQDVNFMSGFWYKYKTNYRRWVIDPLQLDATIEEFL